MESNGHFVINVIHTADQKNDKLKYTVNVGSHLDIM